MSTGSSGGFDWGADESEFPSAEIDPWDFWTNPSNDMGDSETVQVRVDPELARRVDETIQLGKEKGVPLKTRSDFVRFAIRKQIEVLAAHIGIIDEGVAHWLLLEKEASKVAYESGQLAKVKETIRSLLAGLSVLTSENRGDWEEAKSRIVGFLVPIQKMSGENDFLMKLYIRELFSYPPFQTTLEKIEGAGVSVGPVIGNAKKAFKRIVEK